MRKKVKKILIVDDQKANLDTLEALFKVYPDELEIIRAVNGEQALKIIDNEKIAVALVDIMMPDMNGFELCRRIRSNAEVEYFPIMFITAIFLESTDRIKGYNLGCDDYLQKPIKPDELFARVRSLLRTKQLHDDLADKNIELQREINKREIVQESLLQSEQRYLKLFNEAPIALWEEDITGAISYLDKLRKQGITDIRTYLDDNHSLIYPIIDKINVISVNMAGLKLHDANNMEELLTDLDQIFSKTLLIVFIDILDAIDKRKKYYESYGEVLTLSGKTKNVFLRSYFKYANDKEQTHSIALMAVDDITENVRSKKNLRKSAQQLQRSETFLSETGKVAKVGGWDFDVVSQHLRWTDETYRIHELPFDYKPNLTEAIKFYHPDDRAVLEKAIQGAIDKCESFSLQIRFNTSKGKLLWVHAICHPEVVNNKTVKLIGTFQDITEFKENQEALLRSQKELLIRNKIAHFYLTLSGDEADSAITKYAMSFLNSNYGYLGYIDDNQNLVCSSLIRDIRNESLEDNDAIILPKKMWVDLWGQSLNDKKAYFSNKPLNVIGLTLPIKNAIFIPIIHKRVLIGQFAVGNSKASNYSTSDKILLQKIVDGIAPILYARIEKNLEYNRRKLLSTAIDQTAESIFITNKVGTIQYANPAFSRISGYSLEEVIGLNARILKSDQHDDSFYKQLWLTISRGNVWKGRIINKNKDNTLTEEDLTVSPVRNERGKIVNYVGISIDMTNQVVMEKQLQQVHKMEAIGTLAGGIAHDFNNILQGIFMALYLAKREYPKNLGENEFLNEIDILAKRGADLVQQILTFSSQSAHEYTEIELIPILRETLKMLRSTLPTTIKIIQDINVSNDKILGNVSQLSQVIMNICSNASYAMQEMGGVLTISIEEVLPDEKEFADLIIKDRFYIRLMFKDSGLGMPLNVQEHIFEPFYTTKPDGEGTGMGLSVVHGIINDHKGFITVSSHVGKGSTFIIYLPMVSNATDKAESTENYKSSIMGNERILLVDDEETIVKMEKKILEGFGYSVTTAHSGKQALAIYKNYSGEFDLIITDQTMPNMTGAQLAREILKDNPGFPIIIMTGFSESIDKATAQQLGIKDLLQKPFKINETGMMIRKVLDAGKLQGSG